jgi:asparagine synthase (glutamine-hydrolysing)
MCGIVGLVARPGRFAAADLERAVRSLSHRGPDDHGVERIDAGPHWELWLGHARLSILDLTSAGHQPMRRDEGAVVFNGEIYNHRSLRSELEASWQFRSRTDTEVLLAGVLEHGAGFLARTNSQLAAAVWDARERTLLLARDRLGKKPLYVLCGHDVIAFASELKGLAALGLPLAIDDEAVAYYRWLGYVPAEHCIWRGVRKLPAATFARIDLRQPPLPAIRPEPYWDPLVGAATGFAGSYGDAIDATLALLDDATKLRLDADVPVGVFLSSGIDSGLVASAVARHHGRAVTAFVVRSGDPSRDESVHAASVARRLGLDVEVLEPSPQAYARQLALVPWHYDEPHAAASQLAVMGNSEQARRSVTVVLTGDGGDEVFLGYPWAARPAQVHRAMRVLRAAGLDHTIVRGLRTPLGRAAFEGGLRALRLGTTTLDNKIDLLDAARTREAAALYEYFTAATPRSHLSPSDRALLGDDDLLTRAKRWYPHYSWDAAGARSVEELLGALDLVTYLRDDVLQKVDRGTMAYSIEARSPLLDYRLVELGLSLPRAHKIRRGTHKRVLRDAYVRRLGRDLAWAPKRGFHVAEPPELPSAPTREMRWVRGVERLWRDRWTSAAGPIEAAAIERP